jgi:hypothetical protein
MTKQLKRLQKKVKGLPMDDQITALVEASRGTVSIEDIEQYIRKH